MSNFLNLRSGLNNVAEYQASAYPWITASTAPSAAPFRIDFPHVTSRLYFTNYSGTPLKFGFTANGVIGSNYYIILPSSSQAFDIKTNKLFVMGLGGSPTYSLMAGLTTILPRDYPTLTGSQTLTTASLEVTYGYSGTLGWATGLG